MIVWSAYVYYTPLIGKIYDIIGSVKNDHSEEYGKNDRFKLSVKTNIEFIDQLNKKQKMLRVVVIMFYIVLDEEK